jgi:hypothetical protein
MPVRAPALELLVTGLGLGQGAGPDDHTVDGRPQASARQPQGPQVQGVPAVSAVVDPAPFRGVLPLPISALRVASVVLGNPANYHRPCR